MFWHWKWLCAKHLNEEELLQLHVLKFRDLLSVALPKFSDTKVLVLISSIVTCKATSNDNMLRVELSLSIH